MHTFHLIWTIALLVLFVGIAVWAWSGRRQQAFNEAARLPLEDDTQRQAESKPEQGRRTDG